MDRKIIKAGQVTYISEYFANQNFTTRTQDTVFIGRFRGKGDIYRSLLHFELDMLRDSQSRIEQGTPVYLRLWIARNEVAKGAVQTGIFPILSPWDPHSVSWDTQPDLLQYPDVSIIIPEKWVGLILVNINALVNKWLKGSSPNHGLMIKGNEETDSLISFRGDVSAGMRSAPVLLLSSG